MDEATAGKAALIGLFTSLGVWLGHLLIPLLVLMGTMIADCITGIRAAKYRGEKISSYKGVHGIEKKVMTLLLMGVGWLMDQLISFGVTQFGFENPLRYAVAILIAVWLSVNEFISILENVKDIGVKIPSWLLPLIKNIRSKIDSKGAGDKEERVDE